LGVDHVNAVPDETKAVTSSPLFMIFMMMFAIISPAIIVGAIAERMKLTAFALFIPLWILIVYCPIVKWIWGNDPDETGFFALGNEGSLDFAGGTVIHLNAGIAALVAALVVGRRRTFGLTPSRPHSIPFCVLGGALLWFGWFGFNAGSAGAPDHIAVLAFTNTQAAAAAAGLTWISIEWARNRRPTAIGLVSGALAGLVAITPACGYVAPMWALVIGVGGATASYVAVNGVKRWLGYDDSLDAFGIHGVAGLWGTIATGLFASMEINPAGRDGLFYGNPGQLWLQLKPTIYVIIWSGGCTWLLLLGIRKLVGLRPSAEHERIGLDLAEQDLHAYDIERETPAV
jgi:Amt family ammonium transporter